LQQTNGLKKGSQIRFRGIPIGEVEQVALRRAPDGKTTQAFTTLVVRERQAVLREGGQFRLATAGLIGEAFIDVIPGASDSPPLKPGLTVQATIPPTLPLADARNLSSFLRLLELASRMNSLPPEKHDAILKEFHSMVEKALEEQGRVTTSPTTFDTTR
jgi:ABC-type transporter Mla subunit MlaD